MMAASRTVTGHSGPWAGGRLFLLVGILFGAQVGIIMLVGERPHKIAPGPSEATAFRALPEPMDQNQISRSFFAADPTVFASATPHGFSGRAWLSFQPVKYGPAEELEPPFLLALDNRHFGTSLQSPEETNEVPFQLAEGQGPQMEPLPVLSAQSSPRAQSAYHIEGPLAGRPFGPAPTLPSWPTNQLLKNSVVEFAVNPSGEVVLQRLLSRSGAAAADMQAVALTRGLRFLPLPPTNPPLTWSKAIFQWQTVDPTVK